jgi:AcrR family transcriptional regulator
MPERQPRGAATAIAIERSALALVLQHGYDHVTVDMICAAAGISQRTFFNHFPTKDDALLGREHPRVDERAARRFALAEGPLLLDAISLISFPPEGGASFDERFRVIASSPALMSRQMERIAAMEAELLDIVSLRLGRSHPESDPEERAREATMVTHLLAGILRFLGTAAGDDADGLEERLDRTRATLMRVLADSAPEG